MDFYTGNFHKWCCAPRGAAFLWAAPQWHAALRPPALSHGAGGGYLERFIWDGARDYSAQLAVPAALRFWDVWAGGGGDGGSGGGGGGGGGGDGRRGLGAMARHNAELCAAAAAMLVQRWCTEPVFPPDMHGSMALVRVPAPGGPDAPRTSDDAKALQDWLHFARRIECPVKCIDGELFVRISAQVYNEMAEYERLGKAVAEYDWKQRT